MTEQYNLKDAITGLAAAHAVFVPVIEAAGIDWQDAITKVNWKNNQTWLN